MVLRNRYTRWLYNQSPAPIQDFLITMYSRDRSKVKFGVNFNEYLTDLQRTERYSNEKLQDLQNQKIRQLVSYAAQHVPYYQTLFQHLGIKAQDIQTKDDLALVPLLDKSTVQNQLKDFRSCLYLEARDVERLQSSGTTGKALDIYVSLDYLQMEKAFTWLHRSWGGMEVGDKVATFVGFPVVPSKRKSPPFWVHDRVENRMFFSLQHMRKANLPDYAAQLAKFQPSFCMGYPTAIYLMALYLHEENLCSVRPRAVFTSSETLLPHQRQMIEQAFDCQVFDWYGVSEMTANIVQCERGNYHIKAEYGAVEILNQDGTLTKPGQVGELVGTGLNNMAMPLVRYRMGDSAIPKAGTCPCGRGGRLIECITGRTEDVIVTPDGHYLSRLDFIFKGLLNVEEAQLIQERPDHLRVRIVRGSGYTEQDNAAILRNLYERLGNDMHFEIEPIERIPRTSTGKFRYVISKVPLDLAGAKQTGEVLGIANEEDTTL